MTTAEFRHETVAARIARGWVRCYTAGLPQDVRERRLQELESDLWEHQVDRLTQGTAPAVVGLEVLERMVRGIPADILWRFQLEGPKMQLSFPVERMVGVLLLGLLFLLVLAFVGAFAELDTAVSTWQEQFRKFADKSNGEVAFRVVAQVTCGIGLVIAGPALYRAFRDNDHPLAIVAAFALAVAGVLLLASAASYWGLSTFADDVAGASVSSSDLAIARGVAVTTQGLALFALVVFEISVLSFAYLVARERLIPRWINAFALLGLVLSVATAPGMLLGGSSLWYLQILALAALGVWLLLAGATLAMGRGAGRLIPAPSH